MLQNIKKTYAFCSSSNTEWFKQCSKVNEQKTYSEQYINTFDKLNKINKEIKLSDFIISILEKQNKILKIQFTLLIKLNL